MADCESSNSRICDFSLGGEIEGKAYEYLVDFALLLVGDLFEPLDVILHQLILVNDILKSLYF